MNFYVTGTDREWVDENFKWLIETYGYPDRYAKPIFLTEEFFPETLAAKHTAIEPLIADLSKLFGVDALKISFETVGDIRDTYGTPYEFRDKPFECELEIVSSTEGNSYKLFFAKTLLRHPKRLLFNCVYHFIKIQLAEQNIQEDENEDGYLFIYLMGIYLGYGILLSQTMADTGRQTDAFWETKWSSLPEIPIPVMAYAMALNYMLVEENNPGWKKLLPPEMQDQYTKAVEFLNRSSSPLFDKQELTANDLFYEGELLSIKNDFDGAIATLQRIFFLTKRNHLKAMVHNNIGYNFLRLEEYLKSIPHFQKALEIDPGFAYANDNLGFAFIMSGDLDSGKHYLGLAMQTANNDPAYSFRNMALYHQEKGEIELAEKNFRRAFDSATVPVDLLEYFYAKFLLETGGKEKAMSYLRLAVDKGEPEAIDFMRKNYTTDN
ncbi:MAG: tetratricopeptide repeat protein [Chitinophagales bacterium]